MTSEEIAFDALNAINVMRPLTERETDLAEIIVGRMLGPVRLRRWRVNDDARLIDLQATGMIALRIARELDRTPAAVRTRIKRLKQTGRIARYDEGNKNGVRP